MIGRNDYSLRRHLLLEKMQRGSIAIIRTSSQAERTFGTNYRFRPRSSFYYLTGFDEPNAYAVFVPDREEGSFLLFSRSANIERELLEGYSAGQQGAIDQYGADQAFPIEEFDNVLQTLLIDRESVYYQIGVDERVGRRVTRCVKTLQGKVRAGVAVPTKLLSLDDLLQEMRFCKSSNEISVLQQAVDISVQAHINVMKLVRPEMYEYELEAELVYEYYRSNAQPAYSSVVCAGVVGCVMHNRENNNQLIHAEDLVIVDSGAEYNYYAADLTRTFPANGIFSNEQRAIYELVLHVQTSMIALVRPGIGFDKLQETADALLTMGLLELGLLSGDYEERLREKAYKKFFPHNIGHWVGMDIHDEITYRLPCGEWRKFLPGTVLTVEPGLYIRPGTEGIDPKWWNIGVHIEDVILVTENGFRVLSSKLPKEIAAIEALMAQK